MKLLIVESPAKCKKIQEFLGAGWRVQATMGHIRSLKEDLTAIGFDATKGLTQTWNPTYEILKTKAKAITELRLAAKAAETVYLGADDDREGEAIAFHTCAILGLNPATTPRVTFHEITGPALKAAVANPSVIDMAKFHAQQARTMLDMLIGFTLSPCLWRGVGCKPGLSAGRCQTPALRLIYDKDKAIEAFASATTWALTVTTGPHLPSGDISVPWRAATLWNTEAEAAATIQALTAKPQTLTIKDRKERVATHAPPSPFITSSLQQEASSRLGMAPKITMKNAQTLYEGGHITYMRTDNATLSQEAYEAAVAVVTEKWGEQFVAPTLQQTADSKVVVKKVVKKKATSETKKPESAAGAHEAIRPTHMELPEPVGLSDPELRLYRLIWTRTIQSVMAAEQRDTVTATAISTPNPTLTTLEATWDKTRFAGWHILETERKPESEAADVALFDSLAGFQPGTAVPWTTAEIQEKRSAPPSRYTEASLIRELEAKGIGRPSTFATLVETVLDRGYVEKSVIAAQPVTLRGFVLKATASKPRPTTRTEKVGGERDKLRTTALGKTVIEWLLSQFDDMVDYDFTAAMEAQLDDVAKGAKAWSVVLTDVWNRYGERYATVMKTPRAGAVEEHYQRPGELGDGYKVVVCKKGTLFVHEQPGQKARFANVPPSLSVATATKEDAIAAFSAATAAQTGEILGVLNAQPVVRRVGKFGPYVTWCPSGSGTSSSITLNCTTDDTLETLTPKLQAKAAPPAADAVDHTVGAYRIKRGPYGLYMFKASVAGAKAKTVFVGIPEATPWATLTPESAEALYKHAAASRTAAKKK